MIGTLLRSHGPAGMDAELYAWSKRLSEVLWSLTPDERVYLPGRGETT